MNFLKLSVALLMIAAGLLIGLYFTRLFAPKPQITIDSTKRDIGLVELPAVPFVYFAIRNDGRAPLEVQVDTYTGFDDVALHTAELLPGQEVRLRGILQIPQTKHRLLGIINLLTNDPNSPEITLTATGEVGRYLKATPDQIDFGRIDQASLPAERRSSITLGRLASPDIWTRVQAHSSSPYLTAALEDPRGEEAQLTILLATDAPIGRIQSLLSLGIPGQKAYVEILASVKVTGAVTIQPDWIAFLGAVPDKTMTRSVIVTGMVPGQRLRIPDTLKLPDCYQIRLEGDNKLTVIFNGSLDCLINIRDYQIPLEIQDEHANTIHRLEIPLRALPSLKFAYLRH